jgi:hypothetical protein
MNNKTNTWAAFAGDVGTSEAIQRVAFSFGYNWPGSAPGQVMNHSYPVLFFNPDSKLITHGYKDAIDSNACKLCVSIAQLVELFKNPPKIKETEVELNNCSVHKDGSVLFGKGNRSVAVSSRDMDEVIKARNKLTGKDEPKKMLPVVRFRYDSPSSGQRLRKLMVVEDSEDFWSGLDMEDSNTYKRFRKDRVVGAVMLVGLAKDW